MANFRIIIDDVHRTAGLVASSTDPVVNVAVASTQNNKRAWVHRSNGLGAYTITATLEAAKQVAGIAINRHNFSSAATVSVDLKLAGATVLNVPLSNNGTHCWSAWFAATNIDEYVINISDPTNPAGFCEITQIICGPYLSSDYNFDLGADWNVNEDITHTRAASNALRSWGTGEEAKSVRIDLSLMNAADRTSITRGLRSVSSATPIFISLYPEAGGELEADHQFVGKRPPRVSTSQYHDEYWDTVLELEEA